MRTRGLELAYPNAAGIGVGAASHDVAVPPGWGEAPVREFASFTEDLQRLADWLRACHVRIRASEDVTSQ